MPGSSWDCCYCTGLNQICDFTCGVCEQPRVTVAPQRVTAPSSTATLSERLTFLGAAVKWDSDQCARELDEAQKKAKAEAEAGE